MSAELSSRIDLTLSAQGAVSAGTDVDGATVDVANYDGVLFFARIATANAGNFLKAQEGDTTSPIADLAGSAVIAGTNEDIVVLDIHKPLKRYIRAVVVRAGAASITGDLYAIRYKGRKPPELPGDVRVALAGPLAGTP